MAIAQISKIDLDNKQMLIRLIKNTIAILTADNKALAMYNETYRPLSSGKYLNEPQGLAKIYPALKPIGANSNSK
jgi:hypothetical protein